MTPALSGRALPGDHGFATFEERLELVDLFDQDDTPKPNIYRFNGRWYVADAAGDVGDKGWFTFGKACRDARERWIAAGGVV